MVIQLLAGLGVALAIEGTLYALMPGRMQRLIEQVGTLGPDRLRLAGLTSLCVGVGLVALVLH